MEPLYHKGVNGLPVFVGTINSYLSDKEALDIYSPSAMANLKICIINYFLKQK